MNKISKKFPPTRVALTLLLIVFSFLKTQAQDSTLKHLDLPEFAISVKLDKMFS